jgi:hypothetical protein
MAFNKFNWIDRLSEYPSRRKVIDTATQGENVVDIYRDEGTVAKEGTAFDAENMNDLEERIANMFPVSIENGGTGAATAPDALSNLGLNISSGTFTLTLQNTDGTAPTYTTAYHNEYYYRIDKLCYITFHSKYNITNKGGQYAKLNGLPFTTKATNSQAFSLIEMLGIQHNGGIFAATDDTKDIRVYNTTTAAPQTNGSWEMFGWERAEYT